MKVKNTMSRDRTRPTYIYYTLKVDLMCHMNEYLKFNEAYFLIFF